MKLIINKNQLSMSAEQFLRRAGFAYIRDHKTGNESFVRRLGNGFYPRLHMYLEQQENKIVLNLHLDQKQASYAGAHMHNAEYDGPVVEGEIERLKSFLPLQQKDGVVAPCGDNDLLNLISKNNSQKIFNQAEEKELKKKVWWKFWQ